MPNRPELDLLPCIPDISHFFYTNEIWALNDETKILTETKTFFQYQIFWNHNLFSKTEFSETNDETISENKFPKTEPNTSFPRL